MMWTNCSPLGVNNVYLICHGWYLYSYNIQYLYFAFYLIIMANNHTYTFIFAILAVLSFGGVVYFVSGKTNS